MNFWLRTFHNSFPNSQAPKPFEPPLNSICECAQPSTSTTCHHVMPTNWGCDGSPPALLSGAHQSSCQPARPDTCSICPYPFNPKTPNSIHNPNPNPNPSQIKWNRVVPRPLIEAHQRVSPDIFGCRAHELTPLSFQICSVAALSRSLARHKPKVLKSGCYWGGLVGRCVWHFPRYQWNFPSGNTTAAMVSISIRVLAVCPQQYFHILLHLRSEIKREIWVGEHKLA